MNTDFLRFIPSTGIYPYFSDVNTQIRIILLQRHTILKQDNQSAILLEVNGRSSSSKRTKHIEQRFFYITDQVEKGLVKIEHEYTDKMWIDVMTKPKQGMAFRVDRSKVMGCPIDYTEESI
jgi:hypothetical protein